MSTEQNSVLLNFNRGIISESGLARQDIDRLALSSVTQNNMMPKVLGSMSLRPGYEYIAESYNRSKPYYLKFIYDDENGRFLSKLELTENNMRVLIDGIPVQRESVSTGIINGQFTSDLTSWVNNDDIDASSVYSDGGYMSLSGTKYNAAKRSQLVSVAGIDRGVEHAVKVVIERGDVTIKIGSTDGGGEYIPERSLEKGTHSIAFTPDDDFYIEFSNLAEAACLVDSCSVEPAGEMIIGTSWGINDFENIRYDQSGDVVYVACLGQSQKKIIRYSNTSWSIVDYAPKDGPFKTINTTTTRITPSGIRGDISLTSSRDLFTEGSVGSLFRISSIGQLVSIDLSGEAQWSNSVRISGVSGQRTVTVTRSGSLSARVRVQRSVGEEGAWVNLIYYDSNGTFSITDSLDNQIVFYRVGIQTGDYTSGSGDASITYNSGGISGVAKVSKYISPTQVNASVLKDLGGTSASEDWEEGSWSVKNGFPSALTLHDGRLYHGGLGKIYASSSDAYEVFDNTIEGDSAPFTRDIPKGSQAVKWMISLKRMMFGTLTHEWFLGSTSFGEVITNSNANIRSTSNQGCAPVPAIDVDGVGMFVQKSLARVFQSGYSIEVDNFRTKDVSKLTPETFDSLITRIDVQRQPDTRVHCVLKDGTVAVFIYDELEDVKSWVTSSTDGYIEDVIIMPGDKEDDVYYSVRRVINGEDRWYLEKIANEDECVGGDINKQADSFITYQRALTTTISGLEHLEGKDVIVWGDGKDLSPDDVDGLQKTYTVNSGSILLDTPVENAVIGLPYSGTYKSVKMSLQTKMGTSLLQKKRIHSIGFILKDTLRTALKYGPSFDVMYNLPKVENYQAVDDDRVYESYDEELFAFGGSWSTDSRVCLEAKAPRPCTILACVMGITMNEKNEKIR